MVTSPVTSSGPSTVGMIVTSLMAMSLAHVHRTCTLNGVRSLSGDGLSSDELTGHDVTHRV